MSERRTPRTINPKPDPRAIRLAHGDGKMAVKKALAKMRAPEGRQTTETKRATKK